MIKEELDRQVALCQGWTLIADYKWEDKDCNYVCEKFEYRPSTNWQQAGELLEKYKIELWRLGDNWKAGTASLTDGVVAKADTPQRAICLAVLAILGGNDE